MNTNLEIYSALKPLDNVTVIKVHIFEWLRYVVRMHDKRIVKKVLKGREKEELD